MEKLVTLKLGEGSLESGFPVILQISEADGRPTVEMTGSLPPAPALQHTFARWQVAYRSLGLPYRLEAQPEGFATNVSIIDDCREMAQRLNQLFNQWLRSEPFRPLQDKLLERLDPKDQVRLIVQTSQMAVQRLPWHTWSFCDRYLNAEVALGSLAFERVEQLRPRRSRVRVLAVFGHDQGLDLQTDQALLNRLPDADVVFLAEPDRPTLNARLWDPQGWDILFFAGHSSSQAASATDDATGRLYINSTDSLTIPELNHALRKAVERGLAITIFNSCDGLGLAQALGELSIPQVLVMAEPVPDYVAHEFLKSFLEAFARGEPFYLAVREAREKLHGLEGQFPCASWLPVIYQNLAESPPTWSAMTIPQKTAALGGAGDRSRQKQRLLFSTLLIAAATLGLRQFGLFQSWELEAFDQFMTLRRLEGTDNRLLVVEVTEADLQAQNSEQRTGSLSDAALSDLLRILEPMEPRLVGLDIYRDFPVRADQQVLARQLRSTPYLFNVCKVSTSEEPGIAPPPEITNPQRIGFSDFVDDADRLVRRHLLGLTPSPNSLCQASWSFSALLAMYYLAEEGIEAKFTPTGELQLGAVRLEPISSDFGGYQGMDAGGYQIGLNYRRLRSPRKIAETVTLSDVRSGRINPEAIRDSIVLIGSTASSSSDYWSTPNGETAGIFMQAQMISQLLSAVLDERPLIKAWRTELELLWITSWIALGGAISGWALLSPPGNSALSRLILGILASEVGLFAICWALLTNTGYWIPWSPPAAALVVTTVSALIATHAKAQNDATQQLIAQSDMIQDDMTRKNIAQNDATQNDPSQNMTPSTD